MSTAAPTESSPKMSSDSYGEKYNSDMDKSSMESSRQDSATDGLMKEEHDVEAQKPEPVAVEHFVSMKAKMLFLAMYFLLNLTLTISNKAVLGKVRLPGHPPGHKRNESADRHSRHASRGYSPPFMPPQHPLAASRCLVVVT